jgi:hypothetical protein
MILLEIHLVQNKIIAFVLLSFYILLFTGCNDSPTDIGSGLVSQDGVNVVKLNSSVDSINQSSRSFKYVYSLASSNIIMVGKSENVDSKILIKFVFGLTDSLKQDIINDSIIIKESWIEMNKVYDFGDLNSSFNFDVLKVNSFWTASFSADSFANLNYDNIDLGSNFQSTNDTAYSFRIDNSLVMPWLKNSSDTLLGSNNGILLSAQPNTQRIMGFTAYNFDAINDPRLKIVYEKLGGVYADTITGYVASDISIVLGDLPIVSSEDIVIQSSLCAQAKLYFDLSVIPKDATINSAKLTFTIDSSETKTGSTFTNALYIYLFSDSSTYFSSDSSAYGINSNYVHSLDRSNYTFTGLITDMVRAIHAGLDNQGFLVKAAGEINGVEIFALKGSNAADMTKRPKLEIVYSRKK